MSRRPEYVTLHCTGCNETWEGDARLIGHGCASVPGPNAGMVRRATPEEEAALYDDVDMSEMFESDPVVEFDGQHCPRCGGEDFTDTESYPSGYAGRTTLYLVCDNCDFEIEAGRGSVL